MNSRSALLVGGTGLVGGHCLQFLLNEPVYTRVVALVRTPLAIAHNKLLQRIVDFNELEILDELLCADDVFCCLGTTMRKAGTQEAFYKVDFSYPVKLAALVQHCGAKQFLIVTSLGADPRSRIFYSRVKGEVEDAIRKIPFTAVHIFRPSLLLGSRGEQRAVEKAGSVMMSILKYAMGGPLKKYRAVHAYDVARVMVKVAQMNLTGVNIFESQRIQEIADSTS